MKQVARVFKPQRLKLELAGNWHQSRLWEPGYLREALEDPMTVKFSNRFNRFMYSDTASSSLLPDNNPFETQETKIHRGEFFYNIKNQTADKGPWFYYTTKVEDPLLKNAPDWAELAYSELGSDNGDLPSLPPSMSLWLGGAGSTTQAHYDVANNIFIQLQGAKKFTLFPPDQHISLSIFPDCHPRARKSQLLQLPPGGQEIVLQPGDALFIPAFWFHHVEAQEESVSLNIFSESLLRLVGINMFKPLPVQRTASTEEKLSHILATSSSLLKALHLDSSWLKAVHSSRFSSLSLNSPLLPTELPEVAPNNSLISALTENSTSVLAGIEAPSPHRLACVELVIIHLLELWTVSLLGAHYVSPVLQKLVDTLESKK